MNKKSKRNFLSLKKDKSIFSNKKAQGLPLNTIVIAVLVLLVLVVLIYVFSDQIRDFVLGVKSCSLKGGSCKPYCNPGEFEVDAKCAADSSNAVRVCCRGAPGFNETPTR